MSEIEATAYRVSTITCNGSIGTRVDLNKLFNAIEVIDVNDKENGFICASSTTGKDTKGSNPLKKRIGKKKNSEGCFDNAISCYYKLRPDYYPSVKVFINGNIQMTGIRVIPDGEELIKYVFQTIYSLYEKNPDVFQTKPEYKDETFLVRMINGDFRVPYLIRRKELHNLLISEKYQNSCSFQPGTYPGVKLQYFWNPVIGAKNGICKCTEAKCFGKGDGNGHGKCKKVTIAVFESGKILITGSRNFEQVNEAYEYITNILSNSISIIRKAYV